MVDFLKMIIRPNFKEQISAVLNLEQAHIEQTAELIENKPLKAKYYGMEILIFNNHTIIKGSIHKLRNERLGKGDQNYNSFSNEDAIQELKELHQVLKIDPKCAIIQNIEVGVNIEVDFNVTQFLKENIIDHSMKPPSTRTKKNNGYVITFDVSEGIIKLYDKGRQYGVDKEIIRIERKFRVNRAIYKKAQIKTVEDLLNPDKLNTLTRCLVDVLQKANIIDTMLLPNDLTHKQRNVLANGINPSFWTNYHNQGLTMEKTKYRRKYLELINRLKLDKKKRSLINQLNKAVITQIA